MMKNTLIVLILLVVMTFLAYLSLYCRFDGKSKGMAHPARVFGYGSFFALPIIFVAGLVAYFF